MRAPRAAGVAGLVFVLLFVGSLALLRHQPAAGASAVEIRRWYLESAGRNVTLAGLYLAPFAGFAFLWFIAVIRARLGELEDRFFATVFLGSGLLFVALLFAASASAAALVASIKFQGAPVPAPGAVVLARALAYSLLFVYGTRAAAVFMIVTSTIGLRTRTLPRWLAFAGFGVALVLLFSVSFYEPLILLFPLWVAAVSVAILIDPHAPVTPTG